MVNVFDNPYQSLMEKLAAMPAIAVDALRGARAGGIGGAVIGGVAGARRDENGDRHILGGALKGALIGGAAMGGLNAGRGALARKMLADTAKNPAALSDLHASGQYGHLAATPEGLGRMFHEASELPFHAAAGFLGKHANQATSVAPWIQEAAYGMSRGGLLGGAAGAISGIPVDENGERHIVRNMAVGAAGGAALGGLGAAGYGAVARRGALRRSGTFAHAAAGAERDASDLENYIASDPLLYGSNEAFDRVGQIKAQADHLRRESTRLEAASHQPFAKQASLEGWKMLGRAVKDYASRSAPNAEKVIGAGVGAAVGGVGAAAHALAKGKDVNTAIGRAYVGAYAGGIGGAAAGKKIGEKLRAAVATKAAPAEQSAKSNLEAAERYFRQGNTENAEHFENLAMSARARAEAVKRQAQRPFGVPDHMPVLPDAKTLKNRVGNYLKNIRYQ